MTTSSPSNQAAQNTSGDRPSVGWRADPFLLGLVILYGLAFLGLMFVVPGEWPYALALLIGVVASSALVLFLSRGRAPHALDIARPRAELVAALIWYAGVTLLAALTNAIHLELVNGFTNWLFLFLAPLGLLFLSRGRGLSLRQTLRSAGLGRRGLGVAFLMALPAALLFLPAILFSVHPQQRSDILTVLWSPQAIFKLPISFVLAFLLAGFTEEFFFRGILQSRLAAVMRSELRGLVIASLLFGLLHLPYAYWVSTWPTHGNLAWSLVSVVTEQTITGILLGVLWARTHNLATSVLVHTFVNALVIITQIRMGIG